MQVYHSWQVKCTMENTNHQCNAENLKNTSKATSGARNGTTMVKWVSFELCSYSCNTSSLSSTCPSLICNWDLGVLPYLTWMLKISSTHPPPAFGLTAEEKGHQVIHQHKCTILLLVNCSSNKKYPLSFSVASKNMTLQPYCLWSLSSWQFTLSLLTWAINAMWIELFLVLAYKLLTKVLPMSLKEASSTVEYENDARSGKMMKPKTRERK